MRGFTARQLKKHVINDLYGEISAEQKSIIIHDPSFKAIYRASKRNYVRYKSRQYPVFKSSRRQTRINNLDLLLADLAA